MGLGWLFNHGPTWLQITVIAAFISFFSYAMVDGFVNSEARYLYYDDQPTYYEGGYDRYS
jgi:hypothetical protein